MKVIFLDIDGVLNSVQYDREREYSDGNIDKSRLPLVKNIVDATDAFVIIDDIFMGWGELESHLVRTNHKIGRGIGEEHVQRAIELLCNK